MRNLLVMILSLAMIGCQAPTADNGRTLIDPTDLIAVSDAFNDVNSADIEAVSSMLTEDASWAFKRCNC